MQSTEGCNAAGKTLLARACAAQTNATFLKLAGPQLVQMFIGDGAKLVRDAFALAKEKSPCIIFIDEIDAIGTKRFDSEVSGDREVQRTMLELLNQLDGFSSDANIKASHRFCMQGHVAETSMLLKTLLGVFIQTPHLAKKRESAVRSFPVRTRSQRQEGSMGIKLAKKYADDVLQVIAATNRADILDPALMRSGRLDRKIEFPHPTEDARAKILQIHSRKMNVSPDVNFEELARSSDDFNAAQLKAVSSQT